MRSGSDGIRYQMWLLILSLWWVVHFCRFYICGVCDKFKLFSWFFLSGVYLMLECIIPNELYIQLLVCMFLHICKTLPQFILHLIQITNLADFIWIFMAFDWKWFKKLLLASGCSVVNCGCKILYCMFVCVYVCVSTSGGGSVPTGGPSGWFWLAGVGTDVWAVCCWPTPSTVTSSSPGMEDSCSEHDNIPHMIHLWTWNDIHYHKLQMECLEKKMTKTHLCLQNA